MTSTSKLSCTLTLVTGLLWSGTALAQRVGGVVTGNVQYTELNANYCNTALGQDCTGATFTDAHFGQPRPVRQMIVSVRDQSGNILGSGVTEEDGDFIMAWTRSSMPSVLRLAIRLRQRDGLFEVLNTNGTQIVMYASSSRNLTPINGTTSSNPQAFGTVAWTSSDLVNLYAAALWTRESLNDHSLFQSSFSGVEIRAFYAQNAGGPLGTCNSSCAGMVGTIPTIQLDDLTKNANQARIQHEMGHLASQWLNSRQQIADYCYPDTRLGGACTDSDGDGVTQPNTWFLTSGEWMNSAFEEGFATFIGDRAIYRESAREPTTCLNAAGPCDPTDADAQVERSTGNGYVGACQNRTATGTLNPRFLRRSALVSARYLRDVYDTSNESSACPPGDLTCQGGSNHNDTVGRSFHDVLQVIRRFPAGFGDHQDSEPFTTAGAIDNRDGFGGGDYYWTLRYRGTPLVNTKTARDYNCVIY